MPSCAQQGLAGSIKILLERWLPFFFHLLKRGKKAVRAGNRRRRRGQGEIFHAIRTVFFHDGGQQIRIRRPAPQEQQIILHDRQQFPHVPRPGMPLQTFEDGRRQVFFATMVLFQDSIEQQRDVFQTMTQGRYRQLERRQAIIQIHAETPFLHQVEKGLVRCADDPHIDRIHTIAADAQDLSCFEHPQQTQLGLLTDVTDLVQEQRPLVGHLEKAGLAAAFGPVKAPSS